MIIKFNSLEDFINLLNTIPKQKYKMFITKNSTIVLRPVVSSRNLDTYVFEANSEEASKIIRIWGKVFSIDSIIFEHRAGGIE